MDVIWKCPGTVPDPAAIARMRQHFPKPNDPMPAAWFMGDLSFFTPDPNEDAKRLCHELEEIRGGLVSFAEVQYVPVWKEWFRYLLPDLILRANEPENLNAFNLNILAITITTFFNIYPNEIKEEYRGFRDDVVSMLGTRALPSQLARDFMPYREDRLFTDIWELGSTIESYGFPFLDEIQSSILFCLKYFTPAEIEIWAASLFQIESPQWSLQMIFMLSAWRKTLNNVRDKKNYITAPINIILSDDGLLAINARLVISGFDEMIPPTHVVAFEKIIAKHFSSAVYRAWKEDILKHLNATPYNIKHGFYLTQVLEADLRTCELTLFP